MTGFIDEFRKGVRGRADLPRAADRPVERLMRAMGLQGVVHGKKIVTTNPDTARPCPDDKVIPDLMGT